MAKQGEMIRPGCELDVRVAMEVMGWHRHPDPMYQQWCEMAEDGTRRLLRACQPEHTVWPWRPSRDIADAWAVVEKMWSKFSWSLVDDEPPAVVARFWQG